MFEKFAHAEASLLSGRFSYQCGVASVASALVEASRVLGEPLAFTTERGRTSIDVAVAPQSVNLLRLEWERVP